MKYDLKSSFGKREASSPDTLEFKNNYIQYKKVLEVSWDFNNEIKLLGI